MVLISRSVETVKIKVQNDQVLTLEWRNKSPCAPNLAPKGSVVDAMEPNVCWLGAWVSAASPVAALKTRLETE